MNLDFSFYNWDLISNFVLKGLYFSLMLTQVAKKKKKRIIVAVLNLPPVLCNT